jgi:paraquat-inducible protein B
MARRANPALIGGFVVGAVTLAVVGLVVLGGGRFFRQTRPLVAYFEGSVKGVSVGAPVTFRGAKVGSVTDVRVVIDPQTGIIVTPVFFEIDAARLTDVSGGKFTFREDGAQTNRLFNRGLRAELEAQSFVTGQVGIALDFLPDTPLRLTGRYEAGYLEVPTVPSDIERLTRTIESLPVAEIAVAAKETLHAIREIVQSPETRQTLRSLNNTTRRSDEALAAVEALARRVDAQVGPLMKEIGATAQTARSALGDAQATLTRLTPGVESAVRTAEGTLKDYQTLARNTDERLGQLIVGVDRTLAGLARTLQETDEILGEGSPVRYRLQLTLDDLSDAAQSVRVLADSLERNPNSLVVGKGKGRPTR